MLSIGEVVSSGLLRSAFQPIVELRTEAVIGYEALVRGPDGSGFERPRDLFAIARAAGWLEELDAACRRAAVREAIGAGLHAPLALFVNVEPDVLDEAALDDLLALAERSPRAPRIVLEVSERDLAVRPGNVVATAARIRAHGFLVALDDVGAEPTALDWLRRLRPDIVKLDVALARRQPASVTTRITAAVRDFAQESGCVLLAEAVESLDDAATARALGVRLGQGWLYGRPAPGRCGRPHAPADLPIIPVRLGAAA
jgi:EAL domain-containing protein (putative c-di-GMP-specific phosphodiesterase class I)